MTSPTFTRVRRQGTPPLSEEFKDLFQSNLLLYNERQQHFAKKLEFLSSSSCTVDFQTGTLSFGSFSNTTNIWIWSWANASDFPEEILEDACNAKEFGERHKIPEYTQEQILMDKRTAIALAMTVVDVVGAEAFYPADINNGSGIAFISLRDERLFLPPAKNWSSLMQNFPNLLTTALDTYPDFIPNESTLIEEYCTARGEDEWKFEKFDSLPDEIATTSQIEIDPDFQVHQTAVLRHVNGDRICTIIFDRDNCIRNIQINLKQQQTETNEMRQFDFPVR